MAKGTNYPVQSVYRWEFEQLANAQRYDELKALANRSLDTPAICDEAKYWLMVASYNLEPWDEFSTKIPAIIDSLSDEVWLGRLLSTIGTYYFEHGRFKLAVESCGRAKLLFDDCGTLLDIAAVSNTIGVLLDSMGQFDQALQQYQVSFDIYTTSKLPLKAIPPLINTGIVHYYRKQYDAALIAFNEALSRLQSSLPEDFEILVIYHEMTLTYLRMGRFDDADNTLSRMKHVLKNPDPKSISITKVTEAILLSYSHKLVDKGASLQMLLEYFKDESNRFELRIRALKSIILLKIDEYRLSKDEASLDDVKQFIAQLIMLSEQNMLYPRLVDAHILMAKILEIQGDFKDVQVEFDQALQVVKTRHLDFMEINVSEAIATFNKNLDTMRKLIDQNRSLFDQLEEASIIEYLKSLRL